MGRFGLVVFSIVLALLMAMVLGCGSSKRTATGFPVPASIALSPMNQISLEVGTIRVFAASAQNSRGTVITDPISFFSNNTGVVTVASNGSACAGTWDSLTNPQVCTPGPTGVAQVTATSQGVSSPATTIYVHQHIDSIQLSPVATQPNPTAPCISKGQTLQYSAAAFSHNADITSSVGQFSWQVVDTNVVTVNTTQVGLGLSQVQAQAGTPGKTSIFASASGSNSLPLTFTTCPVQSITLAVTGSTATSKTVTATVIDSMGVTITGVPLTWTSSEPALISVASSGVATASKVGGASILASCTPPTCNIGFQPSFPVYPQSAVSFVNPGTGKPGTFTVYATTEGCGTDTSCIPIVTPIDTSTNTVQTSVGLPASPNSFVFNRQGTKAYLGTDLGLFGTRGLMVLDATASPPTVSQFPSVIGRVLAVSPDGTKVIVGNIKDPNSPKQFFVFDTASRASTAFPISTNATGVAADFSPDSLKAFVVTTDSSNAGVLYVYSKLDALQTVPLSGPANDVAFLPEGGFGYIAGGAASAVSILPTCDNPPAVQSELTTTGTNGTPQAMKSLPDGNIFALAPPVVNILTPTVTGSGCAFPRPPIAPVGNLAVSNTVASFSLAQGTFIPRQLIISSDGSTAYILADNSSNQPLGTILAFNIGNQTSSSIALANNAVPLQAAVTPDGTELYVGASDGTVHVVNTVVGGDSTQITFPQGAFNTLCPSQAQNGTPPATCNADLVAVRP